MIFTQKYIMKQDFKIIRMDEVDSTNNEIKRRGGSLDNLSVIITNKQTAGRGQVGNKWLSPPGENLTFSILLRPGSDGLPSIKATEQFLISRIATLSVFDLLTEKGINCRIKWPNDIYVGNKKICGMLIENTLSSGQVASSIVGIGLNVNQEAFSPELLNPTSMYKASGEKYSLEECLQYILKSFALYMDTAQGEEESIKEKYLSCLYRLGELSDFRDIKEERVFKGRIKGVAENAKLIVEMPDGRDKEFAFKEISYII